MLSFDSASSNLSASKEIVPSLFVVIPTSERMFTLPPDVLEFVRAFFIVDKIFSSREVEDNEP